MALSLTFETPVGSRSGEGTLSAGGGPEHAAPDERRTDRLPRSLSAHL